MELIKFILPDLYRQTVGYYQSIRINSQLLIQMNSVQILDCEDGVEYKYLCEKGDWEYQGRFQR